KPAVIDPVDLDPQLPQRGPDLGADEPGPHDHGPPSRLGLGPDGAGFLDGPELMAPGELGAGLGEPAVPATRGDQRLVESDGLAALEPDHSVLRIDPFG